METLSTPPPNERKIIDGKMYEKVYTGYTVLEWYSHSTDAKGPGPGWDTRLRLLEDEDFARRETGQTVTADDIYKDPMNLPDTPYYRWELVQE